jgi:hypothetical protein
MMGYKHGRQACAVWVCLGLFLTFASLTFTGCDDDGDGMVLCLQPSYTPADLETDANLTGSWTTEDGELKMSFEEAQGKAYKLVVTETEGTQVKSGAFEVRLVRLGSSWFLDFLPDGNDSGGVFYQLHFLRAHSVARIDLTSDKLKLAFLNEAWLKKNIEEQTLDTPHREADGTLLLTGSTSDLQHLLDLHSSDDAAFSDEAALTRQEQGKDSE